MGASETIGPNGTIAVVLSILAVFTPMFTIKMDSYWADYWYPADDDTATKAKHAGRKSSNWWTGYGILIFYVIASCFNVASFYNTFYDSDVGTSSRNYTSGVSLFIVLIGLDKGIPVMLHYYSYRSLRNWCIFYGFVSWGITVCTIFVIGFNVSHLAAYLLIPYAAYNTAVNITGWVFFFGRADSTYSDTHGNPGFQAPVPSKPYLHAGASWKRGGSV